MLKTKIIFLWAGLAMLIAPVCVFGQKKAENAAMLKQFINVCNSYKQLPLHASITVRNAADIITSADDTLQYNIEFFIRDDNAYINMAGEVEVINDSLMLFINNRQKRMALSQNPTGHISTQLNYVSNMFRQDSSISKMAALYTAQQVTGIVKNGEPAADTIILKSRALMPGTQLPKEMIKVAYRVGSQQPLSIVQSHVKMIPLSADNYNELEKNALYPGKLVNTGKGYYFLIKDASTEYVFTHIDNDASTQMPLQISNCIEKNARGKYVPAKGFEGFLFSNDND